MTRFIVSMAGVTKTKQRSFDGYRVHNRTIATESCRIYIASVSFNVKGNGIVKMTLTDDATKAQTFAKFMAEDIASQLTRGRRIGVKVEEEVAVHAI